MQLTIGQYTQLGPIHFKYINPLTHGLSYMFILACGLEIIFNSPYLITACLYSLMSLQTDMTWLQCHEGWDYSTCLDSKKLEHCVNCVKENMELSAYLYWQ